MKRVRVKSKSIAEPLKKPTFKKEPVLLPEVFILETLRPNDEKEHRFEGRALEEMLRLSGKNPKYHYFQDIAELPLLIELFEISKYRFLHFSCHGETDRIFTTYGEISDYELARILERHLRLKRLFFSACKVGNEAFSEIIARKNVGMHSIVAPVQKIQFDYAAAVWNALYVSLFAANVEEMTHDGIIARLRALRRLFPVDFHFSGYHSHDKANPWDHQVITRGKHRLKKRDLRVVEAEEPTLPMPVTPIVSATMTPKPSVAA